VLESLLARRGGGLLESLLRRGDGLLLSSLALAFPFREGGLGDRLGLDEYLRRRGGGERDTEAEGLRARRLGGGERDTEAEGLRPRRLGGGEPERERERERERECEDEYERLLLTLRGEGERERDAESYDPLRARPPRRAGDGLRVYDLPRELDRESRRLRAGLGERE
jgi:hypothetical protein